MYVQAIFCETLEKMKRKKNPVSFSLVHIYWQKGAMVVM